MLGETLARIHRLEDLRRLVAELGYAADWREVSASTLGAPTAAIVGRQGEFAWYALDRATEAGVRQAARALAARGLPAAIFGLDAPGRRLLVAAGEAPPLALGLEAPDPLALARLLRCAARPDELPLATGFRVAEALAGLGVDQRFFAAFRQVLARVMAACPGRVPWPDRHALALLQLTRILFLYFVQAKGWLGRPHLLREEVDRCLAGRRSLHRDLLDPLFFGTLNRPYPDRSRLARRFGPVPFLNGGLFEPHPLERRWRVTLPTPVLRDAFDHLFERFHFTLANRAGDAIAPDMLGRVFEGVMDPGERRATGTYYTPSVLVDAVVREALAAWLARRLGIAEAEATRRVDEPDPITRVAFRGLRLLDPAAGSGAFLLGALRRLGGGAGGLRATLCECLFGVDRNPAAVRLAELRLWLEVIAAEPEGRPQAVRPLPNLDAMIRQGDSLFDPVRGVPFRPVAARGEALRLQRLAAARAAGAAKSPAVRRLRQLELEVAEESLRGGLAGLDRAIAELLAGARSPTLFGDRRGLTRDERDRLAALRRSRGAARQRLRELRQSGAVPWFHYPVQFADLAARGGFDLVVGNPPWVRAEALPQPDRRYLAERFRWFRPARTGTRGYSHLPDLSVAFLERSLELAAPEGVVALLMPAKLATTGYGTAAREAIARTTTVLVAADLRRDPRASFEATVYPMALLLRHEQPPRDHRVRLDLGGAGSPARRVPQRALGAPAWELLPDPLRATLSRLRAEFPSLGVRHDCQLGVKTGCNRAFLDPPDTVEPELVRWAVRGRDVAPFRVRPVRRLLWPCDERGNPIARLPPGAARHLAGFASDLRRRSDHRGETDRLWTLFRTRPASARYRVIWPDLARRLTAAPLTGPSHPALIPLNTCYVVPVRDAATAIRLAAWLNSSWCRSVAAAAADPASGGFRRFNARAVSALPAPPALFGDDRLLALGRAGLLGTLEQKDLDDRTARLLQLTGAERAALAGLDPEGAESGRGSARPG